MSLLAGAAACSLSERFAQTASAPPDAGSFSNPASSLPAATRPAGAIEGTAPLAGHRSELQRDAGALRTAPILRDAGVVRVPTGGEPDADGNHCPESLEQRLSVTTLDTGFDLRYKKFGYDGFPLDESVLMSVTQGGRVLLAVRENSGSRLLVISLNSQLSRTGSDLIVWAYDLGGLVALDDGSFTLLTRRDDPGEQLLDTTTTDTVGKAAVLIHISGTTELFAQMLTGTTSITRASDPSARDCAPSLNGRLAWNGHKYGAYFAVHGCQGDPHEPFYGDKLVYVDSKGNYLPGGWGWKCSISEGMRLLAEPNAFTALCMSDSAPFAGLNLVTENVPARQLSPEKVAAGYSAGRFGSVVRMSDGSYVVGWLSRGTTPAMASVLRPTEAERSAQDIAVLRLGPDYEPLTARVWLSQTPDIAETNLHLAPYGPNQVLVVWDNINQVRCNEWTCWGSYAGTSARLMDLQGNFLTPDVRIDAPPNSEQDLIVFPNGDVGWAFVPDDTRNYDAPLAGDRGIPSVPSRHRVSIARLHYCE